MRYLVTFFWVFLLLQMIVYVVSSMNGVAYSFQMGLVLSVPITILICIVPMLLPDDPVEQHH
ncbi:YjzD family protein [Bacillus sp. JJ722]|uniref:YjzD family protein n=1 Tax=Bacillus sp. JJ722 TaxID=3122973 RepID=UPI002FFE16E2